MIDDKYIFDQIHEYETIVYHMKELFCLTSCLWLLWF